MKATGIVRRIDDLGRIVVPKEIRKVLRIREGDPLEIFTGKEGEIVLKKYSPMADLTAFAQQYVEAISQSLGLPVAITDRDSVIAVAGMPKRELMGKELHSELESVINDRKAIVAPQRRCEVHTHNHRRPGFRWTGGADHYIRGRCSGLCHRDSA